MLWPALGVCQGPHTFLTGRIEPVDPNSADLYVELRELSNGMNRQRESVRADGSFRFRDVASGSYEVRVVTAMQNETLVQEFVEVNPFGGQLVLRMPHTEKTRPVSGLVSVQELESRVPKKAFQAFVKAQHYAETAKPAEAIEQLRRAIALDPAWRDAHVNLGAELVRVGRYEEAMAELQES